MISGEGRGRAEASEVGMRKKGKLEPGRGKLSAYIPKNRGQTPGSWGAGPECLNPSLSGGAPTSASCCSGSASESSRNEVGVSWGEARGFSVVQKLHILHPGSLPSRAPGGTPASFPFAPCGEPNLRGQIPDLFAAGSAH